MLVLDHAVKDFIVKWVRHGILRELFENFSLAEWGGVGLSIVLNGMFPQGAIDFQWFQQGVVGVFFLHS